MLTTVDDGSGQPGMTRRHDVGPGTAVLASICPVENILLDAEVDSPSQLFELSAAHVQQRYGISAERIKSELMAREHLGSTGLGQGVAIPHARVSAIQSIVALFIRTRYPVAFNAPDGKPVDEFVVLVMPEEDNRAHLELLADAARLLGERSFRLAARAAPAPADIHWMMKRR